MLSQEILSIIIAHVAACGTGDSLSALALSSKRISNLTLPHRFSSVRVDSVKTLIKLCKILAERSRSAGYVKKMVFDWKQCRGAHDAPFLPLGGFAKTVSKALQRTVRLETVQFIHLPPQLFIEYLGNFKGELARVKTLQCGSTTVEGTPFYERLDREHLISTIFVSLSHITSISFLSPLPRSLLKPLMAVLSSGESPPITKLSLAVDCIDFGVMQEITLGMRQDQSTAAIADTASLFAQDKLTLRELEICGHFVLDPYNSAIPGPYKITSTSTLLKDLPAVLRRLPLLSRISFAVPNNADDGVSSPTGWISNPAVFMQEHRFLTQVAKDNKMLQDVRFPTSNRYLIDSELLRWEPVPVSNVCEGAATMKGSASLQEWWATNGDTSLMEIATPQTLADLTSCGVPVRVDCPDASLFEDAIGEQLVSDAMDDIFASMDAHAELEREVEEVDLDSDTDDDDDDEACTSTWQGPSQQYVSYDLFTAISEPLRDVSNLPVSPHNHDEMTIPLALQRKEYLYL